MSKNTSNTTKCTENVQHVSDKVNTMGSSHKATIKVK